MKKYRCLWCMSTRNHNILYFVCVPRIHLLNTATRLWKAQKPLVQRGLQPPKTCTKFDATPALPASGALAHQPAAPPVYSSSLAPRKPRRKAQNRCNFPAPLCEVWTFRVDRPDVAFCFCRLEPRRLFRCRPTPKTRMRSCAPRTGPHCGFSIRQS
jgi:hypothetical protein